MPDAPDPATGSSQPRPATVVALALAGLLALGWLTLAMLGGETCEPRSLPRLISPNKAWAARVTTRGCGPDTSTEVLIQPLAQPESDALACRAVALKGTPHVDLTWTRFRSVIVTHGGRPADVTDVADQCFELGIVVRNSL